MCSVDVVCVMQCRYDTARIVLFNAKVAYKATVMIVIHVQVDSNTCQKVNLLRATHVYNLRKRNWILC